MRHLRGILRACRPLCGRAGAAADPFAVLGLPRTASQAEIRERYLQLAKQTHPDVAAPSEPVAPFAALSAAYQALTAVEAEAEAREQRAELRAEADALVKAARIGDALGVFSTLCALPCALPPAPAEERQLRATARSLLEACAQRGELTRHAQSAEVWRWIEERDAVVSRPPSERTPPRLTCTSSTDHWLCTPRAPGRARMRRVVSDLHACGAHAQRARGPSHRQEQRVRAERVHAGDGAAD